MNYLKKKLRVIKFSQDLQVFFAESMAREGY
jgi:hypothetical protein